ncbi:MAG TPA: LamG domain-containing protein, partial [Armatimonadetes bacterium]|nr:LamG domain-containing protein [Armatimonadota bacterium]
MSKQTRRQFIKAVASMAASASALSAIDAEGLSERYAQLVRAERALLSYWRMEGDLKDEKGAAHGKLLGGRARFTSGVAGGKALALDEGYFVTMGKAPHLDVPETTIELFFKITAPPSRRYNPCIIAKRLTSPKTRFSIHVMRDLSRLAVWNGRAVGLVELPFGELRIGEWHHLVVSSTPHELNVYIDGVRCTVIGGAPFTIAAEGLPLQIGASSPRGAEQCVCAIDEVAIYGRVLTERDIARHLKAIGWAERREELLRERKRQWRVWLREQEQMLKRRMSDPQLLARGETRIYRGEYLTGISFPI